jgi:hypothetical protein
MVKCATVGIWQFEINLLAFWMRQNNLIGILALCLTLRKEFLAIIMPALFLLCSTGDYILEARLKLSY